jgi:tetratricopeptide (TPR) repeat protein
MYAGALHEHKCLQILMDAFRLVRRRITDAELHIYGDALMWLGGNEYGDNLKRTKPEGAYFHGYVNNKDMPEIYSKHSILCLPSRYETFPMVILESQACGCIPVAHNAGGTAATLSDGQTGLLYSPNTPEKLAETIIAAFRRIDADPAIRNRAINFIRENFSASRVQEYISKLWDRINIAGEVNAVRTLLENNNTALADLKCEQLSRKSPDHPEVLLLQALIMNQKGNEPKADAQIKELLEKYPGCVRALNDYGLTAMKAGDTKKALGIFARAYKLNPWDRNTVTNCYKVLKASGGYEQAKLLLLNYLTNIGLDSRILCLLGEIDAIVTNEDSAVNLVSQQPVNNEHRVSCTDGKSKPLVSMIMPVYNGSGHIGRAIESVLCQSYTNFELVIVDDGSTDNTKGAVLRYNDDRINYVYKENGGVASARNFGLKQSCGMFYVMLDSDDMITPDYIARHLQEIEKHPEMDLIYCDDLLIDEQDRPIRVINRPEYSDAERFISDMFRCGFPLVHFKTFIRRSVFDRIGLYDERLIVAEDYDMMRRFVKQGLKMRHLPAPLYLRRLTATNSLSRNFNSEKAKSHFDVVRRFTETFTPEQLFPDVQWEKLPPEQKSLLFKSKTALVYLGIGEQYAASKAPDYADTAFEMACAELDDCCKIEPENQQVRLLREKCRSIRTRRLSNDRRCAAWLAPFVSQTV